MHDLQRIKQEDARLFKLYQDYDLELVKWNDPGFSLNEERLAKIITGAFHFYAGNKYELHAYCVMSNHIHLLIRALKDADGSYHHVSEIVRCLKSYTAQEINKARKRTGQLWDDFHFDRIIRDERNYTDVVNYIVKTIE
ncbi:MAG: transposase [Candidatus Cloacimonetes bacterium]|nr:transposase [Candidatus Cloacimonadota bacterium]